MSRQEIRQLEQMLEIIARAIPKETAAAKLYDKTAKAAEREMTRMLFGKLAKDAQEHEQKLRATLNILKKELERLRHPDKAAPTEGDSTAPAHEFNVNIRRTMRIAKELKELSTEGLSDANDPSCQAMYGRMQEMSAELQRLAENEVEKHIDAEKWN
ncbi:hypothetical protein JW859_14025 [bacterium]|nr:hypothetical protein [bacterium]